MNKDATITFRCDKDFKVRIGKLARRYNVSVGEAMIDCVLNGFQATITAYKAKEAKSTELSEDVLHM